jgi:hypothetical protein
LSSDPLGGRLPVTFMLTNRPASVAKDCQVIEQLERDRTGDNKFSDAMPAL